VSCYAKTAPSSFPRARSRSDLPPDTKGLSLYPPTSLVYVYNVAADNLTRSSTSPRDILNATSLEYASACREQDANTQKLLSLLGKCIIPCDEYKLLLKLVMSYIILRHLIGTHKMLITLIYADIISLKRDFICVERIIKYLA